MLEKTASIATKRNMAAETFVVVASPAGVLAARGAAEGVTEGVEPLGVVEEGVEAGVEPEGVVEGVVGEVGLVGVVTGMRVPSTSKPEAIGSVEVGVRPAVTAVSMKVLKRVLSPKRLEMAKTGVVSVSSSLEVTLKMIS